MKKTRDEIMIQSYEDYKFHLEADRIALNIKHPKPLWLADEIWRFEKMLRQAEYNLNCHKNGIGNLLLRYKLRHLAIKLGFTIPLNVFGPGLSIAHRGMIVVADGVKVGENCRISQGVTIGVSTHSSVPPVLGKNIFIGPNAVIVGNITLADGIAVGANSYVDKSFSSSNITIAGCPARKVADNGSKNCWLRATEILAEKYP
jgi:serine O-acetyltransferase